MAAAPLKHLHVCSKCGFQSPKWFGRCPSCGDWDALVENKVTATGKSRPAAPAHAYAEVQGSGLQRMTTGNAEVDRTLGGGIVPGSLILLGGEPGIGKSTLLLQVAESLSNQNCPVLYVAGEESVEQIRLRGDRLQVEGKRLFLLGETCLERILEQIHSLRPSVVIVDSIQTVFTEASDSIPGSISQIRDCAAELLVFAKREGVPVLLIGHITKDGALAGPKALEHIVDVVLYFEGTRHRNEKIVRAVKNRFGPSNELGIFEMSSRGLRGVENPSRLFLAQRSERVSGSAVTCTMEGSRPVLVEVQALVSQSGFSAARRMTDGVDANRVALLLAMLEKRLGLDLLGSDVYINVAGGFSLTEPGVDLAIVAAIVSSLGNRPLPESTVVFGEVGLAGEIRAVSFPRNRVKEASMMGFRNLILPANSLPLSEPVRGVSLQGVATVGECLEAITAPGTGA